MATMTHHTGDISVTLGFTGFSPRRRGRLRRVDAPILDWRRKCFGEVKTVFFKVLGRGSGTRFTIICCFESLETIFEMRKLSQTCNRMRQQQAASAKKHQ